MFVASCRRTESNPRTIAAIRAQRLREQEALGISPKPKRVVHLVENTVLVETPAPILPVQPVPLVKAISDLTIQRRLQHKWIVFLRGVNCEPAPEELEFYRRDIDAIILTMCRVFRVHPSEIKSQSRRQILNEARQAIYYWACRLTPLSLNRIGAILGGRDHSTVWHGVHAYRAKRLRRGRHLRVARASK